MSYVGQKPLFASTPISSSSTPIITATVRPTNTIQVLPASTQSAAFDSKTSSNVPPSACTEQIHHPTGDIAQNSMPGSAFRPPYQATVSGDPAYSLPPLPDPPTIDELDYLARKLTPLGGGVDTTKPHSNGSLSDNITTTSVSSSHTELVNTPNRSSNSISSPSLCAVCGHPHAPTKAHMYKYTEEVDADLLCQLCHKPLVDPLDTNCGHTFCSICLKNHLAVQALCPEDKQIINFLQCQQSSNLVKRLLDKLPVVCPNWEHCNECLARCDLDSHLTYWCRGTLVPCVNSKLGCLYIGPRVSQATHRWSCQFQAPSRHSSFSGMSNNTEYCSGIPDSGSQLCSNTPKHESTALDKDNKNSPRPPSISGSSGHISHIDLQLDGRLELGVSLVGGCDTPLLCVIIQEIYLDGLAARDGRLRPGDQILQVNGQELVQCTHLQACQLISSISGPTCSLAIYREQPFGTVQSGVANPLELHGWMDEKQEVFRVLFTKSQEKPLGIKLVGKKNCLGLYVLGLIPDGQAYVDGRLQRDDRILEINGMDLTNGTQEQAALIISEAVDFVSIIVARIIRSETPDILRTTVGEAGSRFIRTPNTVANNPSRLSVPEDSISSTSTGSRTGSLVGVSNKPLTPGLLVAPGTRVCQERVVVLRKQSGESLGMSVAGGVASQRGDVPIYVTNMHPNGIAAQSSRVFRGDILLAVNEIELLGLSHERAVDALKKARDSCTEVTLRLLKGPEDASNERNFIPSWLFWLQLPRYCQIPRLVVLTRDPVFGLGFSIIGGNEASSNSHESMGTADNEANKPPIPKPIVIKSIIPGSPCFLDGRLKCGDILLSVDKYPLTDISHTHAVALLKHCTGDVKLRIVSWPGTIV